MSRRCIRYSPLRLLAIAFFLAAPCAADLFEVAVEINDNITTCDWLYREVHEWARENDGVGSFLASEKLSEAQAIETTLESIDRRIEEGEEQATPATFAATSAFADAQRSLCGMVLRPGRNMERYAGFVERELASIGSLRSDVEAAFGRSLTFARETDPEVYARKKAAWEAFQEEKEASERKLARDHWAAIDQWQRERQAQREEQEDRSQERQKELLSAAEKEQQEEEERLAQDRAESIKEMQEWHAGYRVRVAGVKSSLGKVLAAMEARDSSSLLQSCRQLQLEVKGLDGSSDVFDSPDSRSGQVLRKAFVHMRNLSASCVQGRMTEAQLELDYIKEQLGKAAQSLAEYGLRP